MIVPGHVLVLKLPFANGDPCKYKRPFLVIDRNERNLLELLNISSTKGKERKLLFRSNEKINKYFPPLDQPSFVKLDVLYIIEEFQGLHKSIYKNRPPLDYNELKRLTYEYMKYKQKYGVVSVEYEETSIRQENF